MSKRTRRNTGDVRVETCVARTHVSGVGNTLQREGEEGERERRGNMKRTMSTRRQLANHVVVKALGGWQVLELLTNSKMPLPDDGCTVANCLQSLCYCCLIVG